MANEAAGFLTGAAGVIGSELMTEGESPSADASPSRESFDAVVLPHVDAAKRLARWLMRNEHDADDVVQEASLRALRYFHTFSGGNARAWLLRIVRNTCHSWHGDDLHTRTDPFDERLHTGVHSTPDPEELLLRAEDAALIRRAIGDLPGRHRELLVFRELEGLSYQEMADAMSIPVGTVMSGLSRARQAFRGALHRNPLGLRMNAGQLSVLSHQPSAGKKEPFTCEPGHDKDRGVQATPLELACTTR
jgi:RNA polymerase sigma-70 factor (ECF subfamily)